MKFLFLLNLRDFERNEKNWDASRRITFLQSQIAEIHREMLFPRFQLEADLEENSKFGKTAKIKVFEFFKVMFERLCPSNVFFNYQLQIFNFFFYSFIQNSIFFLQNQLQGEILERIISR